jgi:type VI secretion system secreted protein VgrG
MAMYTQADRPMAITTPLGEDVLLITELRGHEAISELFHFEIDLLAQLGTDIRFDRILGESVNVSLKLRDGNIRYFNGIVSRFTKGTAMISSCISTRRWSRSSGC